jgi:hypothetical protein
VAPFNASNPEAACGIKTKPVCSFDQLLVKSSNFNAANAFVMAVLGKAVYPDAWALPDNDTLVSLLLLQYKPPSIMRNNSVSDGH